ncbi:MAG: hypothetical protein ACD_19C00079G0046 [uncultured bacterium]|nr:MAG: hypothetical protein ACD_19C00079G0046 [uncultured bacterium]
MTVKRYSRLASVEERKNIKNAYFYVILSILAVIFLVFLGLPILVKFAGFVGDVAKSDKPVEINDITPPAPPQFGQLPEFTKKEILEIQGKSESGATISVRANNHITEVVANNDGVFSFSFNLLDGENTIDAKASDLSGNESTQTQTYKITYDNNEPKLEVTSPADGTSYFGSGQRQLSIKGTVNENVDLTINGRIIALKDGDTFSFSTTLAEGENKFEVKAIDPSGNETSTTLTINFSL